MSHLTTYPLSMSLSYYQPASLFGAGDPELSLIGRGALALSVEVENNIFLLLLTYSLTYSYLLAVAVVVVRKL